MMQSEEDDGDVGRQQQQQLAPSRLMSAAALAARFMNAFTCGSFGFLARALLMAQGQVVPDGTYATSAVYQNGQRQLDQQAAPHQRLMNGMPGASTVKNGVLVMKKQQQAAASKIEQLGRQSQQAQAMAIKFRDAGNKPQAMLWLKRKKLYDQQALRTFNQVSNMDTVSINMESLAITAQNAAALSAGASAMKQMTAQVDVEQVGELMSDIGEGIRDVGELSDAISQPLDGGSLGIEFMDEDAMNAELAALGTTDAEADAQRLAMEAQLARLPAVPAGVGATAAAAAAPPQGEPPALYDASAPPAPAPAEPRRTPIAVPVQPARPGGAAGRGNPNRNDQAAMAALMRQLDE